MKPVSVVLAIADPATSESLLNSLRGHFRVIVPTNKLDAVRPAVLKNRADVVLMDVEAFSVSEITRLREDFPSLSVVGIHRLADDAIWMATLAAGALDCCHTSDVRGIVMAVNREGKIAQGHAA